MLHQHLWECEILSEMSGHHLTGVKQFLRKQHTMLLFSVHELQQQLCCKHMFYHNRQHCGGMIEHSVEPLPGVQLHYSEVALEE